MLFHLGALWRLYEAGLLRQIARISSVSGGSITAAVLAMAWRRLGFEPAGIRSEFIPLVVSPIRRLAHETIDARAVVLGIALPGRVSDRVAKAYDKHLFNGATLQDLPDQPRFVINATNLQSGALWRFMKPYMRDYRVGEVRNPKVPVAVAVAASSAFPPVLSPLELRLDPDSFTPCSGTDLQRKPFTSRVLLTDGGVYDNLGIETAWKRYRTVLLSDGGGGLEAEPEPKSDWPRHAYRILNLIDNQVRALRKRQVIGAYRSGERLGAYWGIRTHIADFDLADAFECPPDRTSLLASTPTRLKHLDDTVQERLINWGFAVTDAGLRRHVSPGLAKPAQLPYQTAGI
jgi:NTE family protein